MSCIAKLIVGLVTCQVLAGLAVAADKPFKPDKQVAVYAKQYVRLYFAENPNLLAYKKGVDKQKGIAKYESLQRRIHARNVNAGQSAPSHILEVLLLMEMATAKHSLESLQHLEVAKNALEKCCAGLAGPEGAAAHALLGHLYSMVPSDPLSFGDKQVALVHLQQALSMDGEGAWPNYYYGVYLIEKDQGQDALPYLAKAKTGSVLAGLAGIEAIVHSDADMEIKKVAGRPTAPP